MYVDIRHLLSVGTVPGTENRQRTQHRGSAHGADPLCARHCTGDTQMSQSQVINEILCNEFRVRRERGTWQ